MSRQPSVRTRFLRHWPAALLAVALVASLVPGALFAASSQQAASDPEPTSILLGEYVQRDMNQGDVAAYSVYFPEDADYMVSPDVDAAAPSFDLVIADESGAEVYSGGLDTSEQSLPSGAYTLTVTAKAKEHLSFFVLGYIGTMTDSDRSPGKLGPGSVYAEENVSESRFATISIPETRYPQEVLLYVEGGASDTFYVWVDGEDAYASLDTTEGSLLRFWTAGGDYTVEVQPDERRSQFTLIVFLGGFPEKLALGEKITRSFDTDATTVVYALTVDDVYDQITVTMTPGAEDSGLYVDVVDRYNGGRFYVYGEDQDDGSVVAELTTVLPGTYYIVAERSSADQLEFTLEAKGTPGKPLQRLVMGDATTGEMTGSDETQYYRLDGVERGEFVRVTLASNTSSDFDLAVGASQPLDQWTSSAIGSDEEIVMIAPVAGTYYVEVSSYSGSGSYELLADTIAGVSLIQPGEVVKDSVDADGWVLYGFEITEPGKLLSVILLSDSPTDLDLSVDHFDEVGDLSIGLTSTSQGASEIVSQADAETGLYEARVSSYGDGGDFSLLVRLEDPQELLAGVSAGAGSVAFSDDFSDPKSGWADDQTDPQDSYGYQDMAYEMVVPAGITRWVSAPGDDSYTDVHVQADVALTGAQETAYIGLICRYNADGYYYVDIEPAGNFTIGRMLDKGETVDALLDWTASDAILTEDGAVNALGLDCIGDQITAFANGVRLGSITVDELTSGSVGLEGGNGKQGTEPVTATFDNFILSMPSSVRSSF